MARLNDSENLRDILRGHFPGLSIDSVAQVSGQRVVYFSTFADFSRVEADGVREYNWSTWGGVVVKVSDGSGTNDVARMQQEISILAEVDSKYYPKLFYFELLTFNPYTEDVLRPKLFLTIEERIESVSLLESKGQYRNEVALVPLLIQLITALQTLWEHPNRYVHRDVKPANILIKPDGGLVIIDLGIVRQTGVDGITNTYYQSGPCTPGYASPEQLKNDKKNISYKSDLFAVGVLAYELLSGVNPFCVDGDGFEDVQRKTMQNIPPSLFSLGVCSKDLSDLVARLMEKEPYKRHRNIRNLLASLSVLDLGAQNDL